MEVDGLKVIEPVNDLFSNALDYHTYRMIKKSAKYNDDVANELHKMTKETAVKMKDRIFSGKNARSDITFLQDVKSACEACNIYEGTAMWLFKRL